VHAALPLFVPNSVLLSQYDLREDFFELLVRERVGILMFVTQQIQFSPGEIAWV
jgi:hypothetical protein